MTPLLWAVLGIAVFAVVSHVMTLALKARQEQEPKEGADGG